MKKIAFGLILLIFMFGCASIQVVENHFISKNPDASVLVDSSFKYIGSTKDSWTGQSVGNARGLNYEEESFFFIKEKQAGEIRKSIVAISIQKVETQYTSDLYPNRPIYLEYETITLGNDIFYYFTQIEYPGMKSYKTKWLNENGIILPNCIITKTYSRPLSPNTLVKIIYLEDPPGGRYQCKDWSSKEMLQDEQKEFIKAFSKRAYDSFKIVGYVENYIQTQSPQKTSKENWSETTEKIKALGELLEKKLITQEEYNEKKKKLLEQF